MNDVRIESRKHNSSVDGDSGSILLFLWDDSDHTWLSLIERWEMSKKNLVDLL